MGFEAQHIGFGGDDGSTWYYQVFGSAVWAYTGKTKVFVDHPDASRYFLASDCHDRADHHSSNPTECENDFEHWYAKAKEENLQSFQFIAHFDCGCGRDGPSSWDAHSKKCQTEIVDVTTTDGQHGCPNRSFKAGWVAKQH